MADLKDLTDAELSAELHKRRQEKRDFQEKEMIKFSEQLVAILNEFEKLSGGKVIVRRPYGGYTVEDKK